MIAFWTVPRAVRATFFFSVNLHGPIVSCHSYYCRTGIVKNGAGNIVNAHDIDHRMHDHHIADTHKRSERTYSAGKGGNNNLGEPRREDLHSSRGHNASFRSAKGDGAVDTPLVVEFPHEDPTSFDHLIDGSPPAGCPANFIQVCSRRKSSFAGRNIGNDSLRLSENTVVENDDLKSSI